MSFSGFHIPLTNFILAAEALFLAGILAGIPKARFSAAWYWTARRG